MYDSLTFELYCLTETSEEGKMKSNEELISFGFLTQVWYLFMKSTENMMFRVTEK